MCGCNISPNSNATRVGVLDDGYGWFGVVIGRPTGCVRVNVVVVGHFLAMQLLCLGNPLTRSGREAVQRGRLMRIFAITQHIGSLKGAAHKIRERLIIGWCVLTGEPRCHGNVIAGRVCKSLRCQALALGQFKSTRSQSRFYIGVSRRINDHGNTGVILCCCTHHRRTTNINLLHTLIVVGARFHGGTEGIEVDHYQVKGLNIESLQLLNMRIQSTVSQDPGMHARVQSLHASI